VFGPILAAANHDLRAVVIRNAHRVAKPARRCRHPRSVSLVSHYRPRSSSRTSKLPARALAKRSSSHRESTRHHRLPLVAGEPLCPLPSAFHHVDLEVAVARACEGIFVPSRDQAGRSRPPRSGEPRLPVPSRLHHVDLGVAIARADEGDHRPVRQDAFTCRMGRRAATTASAREPTR